MNDAHHTMQFEISRWIAEEIRENGECTDESISFILSSVSQRFRQRITESMEAAARSKAQSFPSR